MLYYQISCNYKKDFVLSILACHLLPLMSKKISGSFFRFYGMLFWTKIFIQTLLLSIKQHPVADFPLSLKGEAKKQCMCVYVDPYLRENIRPKLASDNFPS